jgi:hypothetical protein
LTLCNTSPFLTRSFQLIFSILLKYHISKLSRYFWFTVRSVRVSKSWHQCRRGVLITKQLKKCMRTRAVGRDVSESDRTRRQSAAALPMLRGLNMKLCGTGCEWRHSVTGLASCSLITCSVDRWYARHVLL